MRLPRTPIPPSCVSQSSRAGKSILQSLPFTVDKRRTLNSQADFPRFAICPAANCYGHLAFHHYFLRPVFVSLFHFRREERSRHPHGLNKLMEISADKQDPGIDYRWIRTSSCPIVMAGRRKSQDSICEFESDDRAIISLPCDLWR
jgi:hypothetical protein